MVRSSGGAEETSTSSLFELHLAAELIQFSSLAQPADP